MICRRVFFASVIGLLLSLGAFGCAHSSFSSGTSAAPRNPTSSQESFSKKHGKCVVVNPDQSFLPFSPVALEFTVPFAEVLTDEDQSPELEDVKKSKEGEVKIKDQNFVAYSFRMPNNDPAIYFVGPSEEYTLVNVNDNNTTATYRLFTGFKNTRGKANLLTELKCTNYQ